MRNPHSTNRRRLVGVSWPTRFSPFSEGIRRSVLFSSCRSMRPLQDRFSYRHAPGRDSRAARRATTWLLHLKSS